MRRFRHIGIFPYRLIAVILLSLNSTAPAESPSISFTKLRADPGNLTLIGPEPYQLLVTAETADGWELDVARLATYEIRHPTIAEVTGDGQLRPKRDGRTELMIRLAGQSTVVPIDIRHYDLRRAPNFENDILPILTRFNCNTSGCHGKAEGQNGFKLSVFGFAPEDDHRAITMEGRGRRVFAASPDLSLLLLKASGGRPHGGGVRFSPGSSAYHVLKDWVTAGCPLGDRKDPQVVHIELSPPERRMPLFGRQQLRVVATFSDGRQVEVTDRARFQSNQEGLATVDEFGLVSAGETPGVVAIMASYMGHVDVFQALIPRQPNTADTQQERPLSSALTEHNFIDRFVYHRLGQLNLQPADVCSDEQFLRRAYLDLIGTLPTAVEVRRFLSEQSSERRTLLINELLERPEFADYWALKLADLMRVDRQALGHKAADAEFRWIRARLAAHQPLNEFARDVVTAEGPLNESPQGNLFKVASDPGKAASAISQIFLGIRIECAQCHHHPFDRWSQTDYLGMAAYFAQLQRKNSRHGEILQAVGDPVTKHPRTGAVVTAHPLGEPMPEKSVRGDRRRELATWMAAPENPYFARNWANRVWAHMLGRGLVEPVDDFRATNPPSNPELLGALSQHFVDQRFDLRSLVRTIASSRVYQHSSRPNHTNERDEQNYSRFLLKRLESEVMLDAVCQVTGVPEKFEGVPAGTRAIHLWDSQVDHYFLRLFGRPTRQSVCECERVTAPSLTQVLHLLNSERVNDKLAREDGRVYRLERTFSKDSDLVEELYLNFFARFPTQQERDFAVRHLSAGREFGSTGRREAAEDLAWTMINALEFTFNH